MSSKKRPTIGNDPLDALFSPQAPARSVEPTPHPEPLPKVQEQKHRKTRATFHIPEELFEEARDAAVQLAGPPARLTLSEIVENGIRAELERLKKKYNEGKPFDKREGNLKGGRPIGS